jgi:hypothetical protein
MPFFVAYYEVVHFFLRMRSVAHFIGHHAVNEQIMYFCVER